MNSKTYNFQRRLISLTPVLSTDIYADGDVLAVPVEVAITDGASPTGLHGQITAIEVVDTDNQGDAFDLLFAGEAFSLGALNDAAALSAADAKKITGVAEVAEADYTAVGGRQIALLTGLNIPLRLDTENLYVGLVSRATGTYTADGMLIRLHIQLDNTGW